MSYLALISPLSQLLGWDHEHQPCSSQQPFPLPLWDLSSKLFCNSIPTPISFLEAKKRNGGLYYIYSLPKNICSWMLTHTLLLYLLMLLFAFIRAVPSWLGNEALIGGTHTTASFCWNSSLAQNSLSCPNRETSMGVSCASLGVRSY